MLLEKNKEDLIFWEEVVKFYKKGGKFASNFT
jgi:hypothetical protein